MPAIELLNTPLFNNGLIAYYRMESGGLTTDSKGSYTLTNNGTVTATTGKFGSGADGGATNSSKYFNVDSALGLSGGNAAKSVFCWFKMNTELSGSDSYGVLVSVSNADTDTQYRIGYWRDGGVNKVVADRGRSGIGTTPISSNQTLGTSTFYHLGFTWDGTNLTGYFNGASIGTSTPSGNGNDGNPDRLTILRDTSANYQSAVVDDVAIFNRALTATEISNLYNGTFTNGSFLLNFI